MKFLHAKYEKNFEFSDLPNWLQNVIVALFITVSLVLVVLVYKSGSDCQAKGGVFIVDSLVCVKELK